MPKGLGYSVTSNFRYGLDTRRSILTSLPGTLVTLENGHVNQGGEIEVRKKFGRTTGLTSTFGLVTLSTGMYCFGSIATPAGLPANVNYQQLTHPDGATAMTGIQGQASTYAGKTFVIATFADGNSYPFYNALLVSDFIAGLILAYQNTNTKIATGFAAQVNRTTGYSGIASGPSVDVTALPNSLYSAGIETDTTLGSLSNTVLNSGVATVSAASAIGQFSIVAGTSGQISSVTVGAIRAFATLTSNGTNVSDSDTVTIAGVVYTFKTTLTGTNGQVLIGANSAKTLANLISAINFTGFQGVTYFGSGPNSQVLATPSVIANVVTVYAITAGTAGNTLAVSKSATTLLWSGATLGSGSASTVITSGAVAFTTNINATALAVANNITAFAATGKFTAVAANGTVLISSVATSSFANGASLSVVATGSLCVGSLAFIVTQTSPGSTADVSAVTVNTVNIMTAPVSWTTDVATILAAVVANINANSGTSLYLSSSLGNLLYISRVTTTSVDPQDNVTITFSGTGLTAVGASASGVAAVASPSSVTTKLVIFPYFGPSAKVTALAAGGTPPYTYAWSEAGAVGFSILENHKFVATSTQQIVQFIYNAKKGGHGTGVYQCVVSDSASPVSNTTITVAITAKK